MPVVKTGRTAAKLILPCEVKAVTQTPSTRGNEKGNKKNVIEGYQEVETWLKTVSRSSRPLYLNALRKFCEFSGKTPGELISTRDSETKSDDHNYRTGIRDLILDFRTYMSKEGYAHKTINATDGAVRGFFTANLGKVGMVNVKNYRDAQVSMKKDLIPTLEELKKILDVSNLEEKFRVIFLAQTGMRISDALSLKVGDIQRELDLENIPMGIEYLPEKEKETVGMRLTFLASDGVKVMKDYLEWRKKRGENVTLESPLFASRIHRGKGALSKEKYNKMLKSIAKRAGLNGDWKYGMLRAHSFRKFFVTQLTNHGVEDKVVNFFIGHKIPEVDRMYWSRKTEDLRKIYSDRQQHLNPLSLKQEYDLSKIEGLQAKIAELESQIQDISKKAVNNTELDVRIVSTEGEIIELARQGYDCQPIGENKWMMKRGPTSSVLISRISENQ